MSGFLVISLNLFGATAIGAILVASGARLRKLLGLPVSPGLRWSTDLALGAGLCSAWVLLLGLVHLLNPVALTTGLVLQGAIARWRCPERPQGLLIVAIVAGLPNLLIAAGPPHFYDAMVYHLGLPWQALQEGAWSSHPENVFSAFPPLAQLVATPALALDLVRAPALLHWFAWVCAATAAGTLGRRMGAGRKSSLLLTATVMLLPITPLVPGFPAAEGWFLAALLPALALSVPGSKKQATMAGVFLLAGLAAGARVQGLGWAAILIIIWCVKRRSGMAVVRALPWCIVGASPWWVKNLILLGDPIAPLLWDREGLNTLWRDGSAYLRSGMSPLEIVTHLPIILAPVAPILGPALVLAALFSAGVRSTRVAFTAALAGLLMWAASGALPRFLCPTLVLLMVTVLSFSRSRIARWAGIGLVSYILVFGIVTQVRWMPLVRPLMILPLSYVEASPYVAPSPPLAAFEKADSMLPPDARVLLVGDARAFGIPRPGIVTSQHDPSILRGLMEGQSPPGEIAQDLVNSGVSHLILNTGELERLGGDYPVAPWKTTRGEGRWTQFLRHLGPPVIDKDGVRIYELTATQTLPK